MPAVAETPRSENVATPFDAVAVVVPTSSAEPETLAVITVELSLVTKPFDELWIATAGWVVNAAPDAAPAALVSIASLFAVRVRTQIAAVLG